MFRRIVLAGAGSLVIAAVFAFGMTATGWQTAEALTNCTTGSEGLDAQEIAALQAINAFRAANGKPPFLVAPTLNRAAAWKSSDSSSVNPGFSHTDSLGRSPYQRAIDCGYPGGAAENIAYGYPNVVQAWIDSDGHRANLLGNYQVVGIGRNGNAWTANFGFTVEPGSFPVPGSGGGGNATAPAGTATEPPVPGAARTVLPSTPYPQYKLPANVPVKRAMMQMVAFE